MSLHFNLQCQRATLTNPLCDQVPDRHLVRGRRRALRLEAVGSSSATGAAYGPLEASRQQLFFGLFRFLETGENPGTAMIICPLLRWVKMTAAVVVGVPGSAASAALPVGRERPSIGVPPGLQALFCGSAKFSVPSLEDANPFHGETADGAGSLWPETWACQSESGANPGANPASPGAHALTGANLPPNPRPEGDGTDGIRPAQLAI